MKRLGKRDILGIVGFLMLVTVFIFSFSLVQNAIELSRFTAFRTFPGATLDEKYTDLQKPLADLLLVAAIVSFAGCGIGGLSLVLSNKIVKTVGALLVVVIVVAFIVMFLVSENIFMTWYRENFDKYYQAGEPYYNGSTYTSACYILYSGVSAAIIKQLAAFIVMAVVTSVLSVLSFLGKKIPSVNADVKDEEKVETAETVGI